LLIFAFNSALLLCYYWLAIH